MLTAATTVPLVLAHVCKLAVWFELPDTARAVCDPVLFTMVTWALFGTVLMPMFPFAPTTKFEEPTTNGCAGFVFEKPDRDELVTSPPKSCTGLVVTLPDPLVSVCKLAPVTCENATVPPMVLAVICPTALTKLDTRSEVIEMDTLEMLEIFPAASTEIADTWFADPHAVFGATPVRSVRCAADPMNPFEAVTFPYTYTGSDLSVASDSCPEGPMALFTYPM